MRASGVPHAPRSSPRQHAIQVFIQGGEDAELEANKAVSQEFIESTDDEKDKKLWGILQGLPKDARVIIFANTKRRVDYLQKGLWEEGLSTCSIHGDKQQAERDKALKQFCAGELPLLFATDVASRGTP
ncbi:P-loop containing nucleoside triphosphate hydrolase protein [Baffinella frigidus]|nr:P-loop containing nucleoside triphosphate hydrolase protein [Cryptophyta sp. CCMP2293]